MYNTKNLRHDANFRTKMYQGVYWIPVSNLGISSLMKVNVAPLIKENREELASRITTIYEALQVLQICEFEAKDDNTYVEHKSELWEYHRSGKDAFRDNEGCCASVASWLCTVLEGKYDEIRLFSLSPLIGNGHVINYIKHRSKEYIIDPYAMLNAHSSLICDETGLKSDFRKSKIMTCGLFEIESLTHFANFYARRHFLSSREFLFFLHKDTICAPICRIEKDGNLYLKIKSNSITIVEQKNKNYKMFVDFL